MLSLGRRSLSVWLSVSVTLYVADTCSAYIQNHFQSEVSLAFYATAKKVWKSFFTSLLFQS